MLKTTYEMFKLIGSTKTCKIKQIKLAKIFLQWFYPVLVREQETGTHCQGDTLEGSMLLGTGNLLQYIKWEKKIVCAWL